MKKILNIFKIADLRFKVLFTIAILFVYRVGGQLRIPFLDNDKIAEATEAISSNSLLGLYDVFVGGFLSQASIFTLGIMPYISASIAMQLLGAVVPYFQRLQKEGELGRRKITQYTRYGTVLVATIQSIGIATFLQQQVGVQVPDLITADPALFYFTTILTLVTGTMFVMWLGEQITEFGIGNGISLIIMAGIIARFPFVVMQQWGSSKWAGLTEIGNYNLSFIEVISNQVLIIFGLLILMFAITVFTVLVTTGVRKIPVQYAKRVVGRKVYGGQDSHIPLKILTAGVMPIIFAQALMMVPGTLITFFPPGPFVDGMTNLLNPISPAYIILSIILIIVFTYFYTAIAFNPVEVADNLKKSSGHIPGVRPGKATSDYIDNILTGVTLPAAFFLAFLAILPSLLFLIINGMTNAGTEMNINDVNNLVSYSLLTFFGGTSLIILVGVALDTLQQIESHMVMRNYDGFLKSGRIRGRSTKRY